MKALVLSSGLGLRLRPITLKTPKPIVKILNLPMICFSIYPALRYTETFIFNLSYLSSKLKNAILDIRLDQEKQFLFEGSKPLGVPKGILNARSFLKNEDDFFVINADTLFLPEQRNFLELCFSFHKSHNSIATFVVTNFKSNHDKLLMDESGKLLKIEKGSGFHFTGYYILNKKIFNYLSFDQDLFKCVLKAGEHHSIKCFFSEGLWFETGNEDSLTKAKNYLAQNSNSYLDEILKYYS